MKSQRIAIFLPTLHGGGAERVMLILARGLLKRGYAVDLVLAQAVGPYLQQLPAGMRLVDLRASRVLTSLPGLARYLRRERPAALISALDHANVIALWARRLARVALPVIVTVHNPISVYAKDRVWFKGFLKKFAVRREYPRADAVVAVSNGVANDLTAIGIPGKNIHVIYNPVITPDIVRLSRAPAPHPWLAARTPVVLAVGRLTRQKDFPTLLRAFAIVRKHRPARLIILGEGEDRPRLDALARTLGVADDVAFPGFVQNPFAYLSRAAVYVLSSVYEGLPTVIIEALACGTPVVATDCPFGPAEILENGRYGRLVPVRDPPALATAIEATFSSHPSSAALRRRAALFSIDRGVSRYISLIKKLTQKH